MPVASMATSASLLDSLPIVHPIPFKNPLLQHQDQDRDRDLTSSSVELQETAGRRISTDDSSLTSDEFDDFDSSPSVNDEQRPLAVTFQEMDSSSPYQEADVRSVLKAKKGCCFRCSKGSWFTEKEACLVCDARYYSNCVLRAMGLMPERGKCMACIGFPIWDTKREKLGMSRKRRRWRSRRRRRWRSRRSKAKAVAVEVSDVKGEGGGGLKIWGWGRERREGWWGPTNSTGREVVGR